jgi:hypothetical protein
MVTQCVYQDSEPLASIGRQGKGNDSFQRNRVLYQLFVRTVVTCDIEKSG